MPPTRRRRLTWSVHKERWKNCEGCDLCKTRRKVVLARGSLPCTVLFCGEGPGESEDIIGKPFVGPAGNLLNEMIEHCWQDSIEYAITNLVCCIPRKVDENGPEVAQGIRQPKAKEIKACSPRFQEIVSLAKPQVVICCGKVAEKYVPDYLPEEYEGVQIYNMIHPAAVLRADPPQQGIAHERSILLLQQVRRDLNA